MQSEKKTLMGIQAAKKNLAGAYKLQRKISQGREKYATLITYITY